MKNIETIGGGVTTSPDDGRGVTTPPAADPYEGMELIPAGEFRMGSNSGNSNEKPEHSVYVDAFYMDAYEVTNAEYAEFLNAKGKHTEYVEFLNAKGRHIVESIPWLDIPEDADERSLYKRAGCHIEYVSRVYRARGGYENHPVVRVSWYGAMAYSAWKGKRLPTEAEWEKAARGGLAGMKYPWGNSRHSSRANYNNHVKDTTAVGKYAANGYGLYDMCGNVWEWCLDEYNWRFYAISPSQNPLSGANSTQWLLDNYTGFRIYRRVVRGGVWNWYRPAATFVRVADRSYAAAVSLYYRFYNIGFRCARTVSP